jgi:3-oxoacyl-[acyl-carrier protein] reductase
VVVDNLPDLSKPEAVKMLVEAAMDEFGGFDAAFLRSGYHAVGDIMDIKPDVLKKLIDQNFTSVVYALQAVLPYLMDSGSGQVLINTSATGQRPTIEGAAYSATRAGANMLVRCAAMTAAAKGVSVNAFGTMFLNYPGFLDSVGADKNPAMVDKVDKAIPLGRLGEPEEAAHFAMTLLDGINTYQAGNFFCHGGGFTNEGI